MAPSEIATVDEEVEVADVPKMYWLPSSVYVALKWATLVAIPAIGVFYQALAGVWSLPLAEEVAQTCNVVALLLGALIGVSAVSGTISKAR